MLTTKTPSRCASRTSPGPLPHQASALATAVLPMLTLSRTRCGSLHVDLASLPPRLTAPCMPNQVSWLGPWTLPRTRLGPMPLLSTSAPKGKGKISFPLQIPKIQSTTSMPSSDSLFRQSPESISGASSHLATYAGRDRALAGSRDPGLDTTVDDHRGASVCDTTAHGSRIVPELYLLALKPAKSTSSRRLRTCMRTRFDLQCIQQCLWPLVRTDVPMTFFFSRWYIYINMNINTTHNITSTKPSVSISAMHRTLRSPS